MVSSSGNRRSWKSKRSLNTSASINSSNRELVDESHPELIIPLGRSSSSKGIIMNNDNNNNSSSSTSTSRIILERFVLVFLSVLLLFHIAIEQQIVLPIDSSSSSTSSSSIDNPKTINVPTDIKQWTPHTICNQLQHYNHVQSLAGQIWKDSQSLLIQSVLRAMQQPSCISNNNNNNKNNNNNTENNNNNHSNHHHQQQQEQNEEMMIQDVLSILNVYRLNRSILHRVNPLLMEEIISVVLKRIQDPNQNPPLKIAVLGGSSSIMDCNKRFNCNIADCSWPTKLQILLNDVIKAFIKNTFQNNNNNNVISDAIYHEAFQLVTVYDFTMPQYDSSIMTTLFQYDMWPNNNKDDNDDDTTTTSRPSDMDVFLLSYSTNDGLVPKSKRSLIEYTSQSLVRTCQMQRPCSDLPLVMILEAYPIESMLFNNKTIHENLWYTGHVSNTLLAWGGQVMGISFANTVRDYIYQTSNNNNDKSLPLFTTTMSKHHQQQHPFAILFQIGITYVLAWNILQSVLDSCDAPMLIPEYNKPDPRVSIPLPILNKSMYSTEIPDLWAQEKLKLQQYRQQVCFDDNKKVNIKKSNNSNSTFIPTLVTQPIMTCPFKWYASRWTLSTKEQIHDTMMQVVTNVNGWEPIGYPFQNPRRISSWQGTGLHSTFTIQLDNERQQQQQQQLPIINQMMILYVKRYTKQENNDSQLLQIVVQGKINNDNDWTIFYNTTLSGTHDDDDGNDASSLTSNNNNNSNIIILNNYVHEASFTTTMPIGSIIQATFTIIGGDQFQINGMAFCNSELR